MNDDILIKYFCNAATEEEVTEILQWVEQSTENKRHFARLHDIWTLANMADAREDERALKKIRNRITGSDASESNSANNESSTHRIEQRKTPAWLKISFAAAAVVIIALLAADLHIRLNREPNDNGAITNTGLSANIHEIYTPKGAKANILLPDSSVVKLNSDSKIIFPDKFTGNERVVYIEGEGFFDVKSNPEAPMTVRTSNGYDVKVLGTKFNIYSYREEERSKTSLLEGNIDILSNESVVVQLEHGDSFVKDGENAVKNSNDADIDKDIAWTNDILAFENTPLNEVIKRLERWYGTTFIVKDSDILKIRLTAEYENESVIQILESIKFSADIEYTIKKNRVELFYGK